VEVWEGARDSERKQFLAISMVFGGRKDLLSWLFDPTIARLRFPAEVLKKNCRGMSSGDQVLIKIAIDLWCEQGGARITDLQSLDSHLTGRVSKALEILYVF
jgi:hypothetical protein